MKPSNEEQCTPAKSEIDEQPWIGKRLIDETGLNEPSHAAGAVNACARAETNMIIAHSPLFSSKRRM